MIGQGGILVDVGVAALLGGAIGLDREIGGKTAGLRTHMIVAAASALFVNCAALMIGKFAAYSDGAQVSIDPTRVIQAIVTGISFLGAGTIVMHRKAGIVKGLTTAASILLVSAIGMTVATGAYLLAFAVTGGALLVLAGIGSIEKRFRKRRGPTQDDDKTE